MKSFPKCCNTSTRYISIVRFEEAIPENLAFSPARKNIIFVNIFSIIFSKEFQILNTETNSHGIIEIETVATLFERLNKLRIVFSFVVAVSHLVLSIHPILYHLRARNLQTQQRHTYFMTLSIKLIKNKY